jgi:hypothetical protein
MLRAEPGPVGAGPGRAGPGRLCPYLWLPRRILPSAVHALRAGIQERRPRREA